MNKKGQLNPFILIGVIGLCLVGLFLVFSTFYVINAGERGVVTTWGNPSDIAQAEGLHMKWPIAQNIIIMDIKTLKYEADASAASKDLQTVTAKIVTNYHLESQSVSTLYKEIGIDYANRVIAPMEQEVTKATISKFTAEELITKREMVRIDIKNTLYDRLLQRGIIVEEVSIVNFDFSPKFNEAIEAKVTAEQNALAAKNKLQQTEYEAQQLVATAKGKAEAMTIEANVLKQNEQILQLRAIEKWNGNMPSYIGGNTMPLVGIGING